jgi:redox-sensitive bicupin YhaK (pirin superfamily)
MSNLERAPSVVVCGDVAPGPPELLVGRDVVLGGTRGMTVTRTLPHRDRRMVGAWCFVDRYGPEDITGRSGMRVPPHPHTGLQTVSWLLAGDILHRDSLGSRQLIRPGQLNLMTAGRGIAHAEESPAGHGPVLDGVQLWVALPSAYRAVRPDFAHHADLPVLRYPDGTVTVIIGELAGAVSGARAYTPIVGAEVTLSGRLDLPLRPEFEYAVLVLSGAAAVDDIELTAGPLLYLGTGRPGLSVRTAAPARLLLLGGEPFEEQIVMWWNFVGGSHEDVVRARADWAAADPRFGTVHGYDGDPLPAPVLPATALKPRGRHR